MLKLRFYIYCKIDVIFQREMSEIRHEPLTNLSSIESATANPSSSYLFKGRPKATRHSYETFHDNIRSPRISKASPSGSNVSSMPSEVDTITTQSSYCLDVLTKITDIILILGAVTIMISLCIVFSIVVFALLKVYSVRGFEPPRRPCVSLQTNTIERSNNVIWKLVKCKPENT